MSQVDTVISQARLRVTNLRQIAVDATTEAARQTDIAAVSNADADRHDALIAAFDSAVTPEMRTLFDEVVSS